jgi:uncharacterized membrane protein
MQQHARITEASFMQNADLKSSKRPLGRPIHRMLVSFSVAYFAGALATDLAYWQMAGVMWERFSIWLMIAGLIMAGLATIAYVIDLAARRRIDRPISPRVVGYAIAVLLALTNASIHRRDGYIAAVPTGPMISGLVVVVFALTTLVAEALTNRHRYRVQS